MSIFWAKAFQTFFTIVPDFTDRMASKLTVMTKRDLELIRRSRRRPLACRVSSATSSRRLSHGVVGPCGAGRAEGGLAWGLVSGQLGRRVLSLCA